MQDWTPIIFKKTLHVQKETVAKSKIGTAVSTSGQPVWKIEQQIDSATGTGLKFVDSDIIKQIINGRVAMKLTQKQLAQKLNMLEKDIKDIESGKSLENKATLAKIKRTLLIK